MAESPSPIEIAYSLRAKADLERIWEWTARTFSRVRADSYLDFLQTETEKLLRAGRSVHAVPGRPEWVYVVVKRRGSGHGHVAVAERRGETLYVLGFFHTAMDWQSAVRSD